MLGSSSAAAVIAATGAGLAVLGVLGAAASSALSGRGDGRGAATGTATPASITATPISMGPVADSTPSMTASTQAA